MSSCIFRGYVEETPEREFDGGCRISERGYAVNIYLISMKDDTREEEKFLPLPKHFKIYAYCPAFYKENEDDQYKKIDLTLEYSLIPSIHVGSLIEFRGTPYKIERNKARNIVIPQQIKTANEIEIDRHYIRIMPPSKEGVKRYDAHVTAEHEKKTQREQRDRKWQRKSWRSNRVKDIKREWVVIAMGIITIIVTVIVTRC